MNLRSLSWLAILFSCSLSAQELKPFPQNAPYTVLLERTGYIDLESLDLSDTQRVQLANLLSELEASKKQFRAHERDSPVDYRTWRREQDTVIEKQLREVLLPSQIDWLIIDDNTVWLETRINAPAAKNEFGSILGTELLVDLLGITQEQQDKMKALDKKWGAENRKLHEELAKQEDKMARTLDEKLRKILDGEQPAKYDDLVGDPVAVVEPYMPMGLLENPYLTRFHPSIVSPPRNSRQLSQDLIEVIAKRLVFSKKLEDDLALAPSQQKRWDTLRENLEESIKPHELGMVLNSLGTDPIFLDYWDREEGSEQINPPAADQQVRGISRAAAQKLTLDACSEAFEVLLAKQQQWLRQVALQYYVASSGGKFPLRFDWVRGEVNVRSDQARQMDELLEEHDTKLNELAQEYVERDRKQRDEAEREFYDVFTPAQKKTLALYLGPPKWETEEKDPGAPR